MGSKISDRRKLVEVSTRRYLAVSSNIRYSVFNGYQKCDDISVHNSMFSSLVVKTPNKSQDTESHSRTHLQRALDQQRCVRLGAARPSAVLTRRTFTSRSQKQLNTSLRSKPAIVVVQSQANRGSGAWFCAFFLHCMFHSLILAFGRMQFRTKIDTEDFDFDLTFFKSVKLNGEHSSYPFWFFFFLNESSNKMTFLVMAKPLFSSGIIFQERIQKSKFLFSTTVQLQSGVFSNSAPKPPCNKPTPPPPHPKN